MVGRNFWFLGLGICFNLIVFSIAHTAIAADNSSKQSEASVSDIEDKLGKLESKLFQHRYPKDNTDARLDRIEKIVFGESQKGCADQRVASLVKAVPNLDNSPSISSASSESSTAGTSNKISDEMAAAQSRHHKNKAKEIASEDAANESTSIGNYPAVTAMETKLFGKDYASEPIKNRLSRLEKKALGSESTSDDLSERVDKLKTATGIDIARRQNSLSDWIDDDDDMLPHKQYPSSRGDDLTYSNRNIYEDMQRSYGIPTKPMRSPFSSAYIPDNGTTGPGISIKSFGISQQVTALEHEIFGKSYERDPLPARLNRLEASVFPGQKPSVETPIPQRVQTLLAKVPIRQQELQSLAQTYQIDPNGSKSDAEDLNNANASIQKSRSNLSRIMGSLGNMLSGGGMTGSYATNGGNYVLDPSTGMLIDPNTGTMINPNTGTTYGARGRVTPNGSYGYNNYGMSPFGSPYGMGGFGSGFGFGSGGFGFGFR